MKYTEQILFIVTALVIFTQAFGYNYDSYANYKKGLAAVVFILYIESLLKGEIIYFKRMGLICRLIIRVTVLYTCGLVFLAFQNEKDGRQLLSHLSSDLGKPVTKEFHTYDDQCELTVENVSSNFDHYYAMHVFGWFLSTFIVRERWLAYTWQLLDEILELSFKHILPHFAECWWDQVIIDVFLANLPAIEIAIFVMKKFNMKQYDWLGREGTNSISEWKCFHSYRQFGALLQIFYVVSVNFLCGFFLINSLWIPPQNYVNISRLLIWVPLCIICCRELYTDLETQGTVERIKNPVSGRVRWVVNFLVLVEVFVSVKYLKDAGNWNENFVTPMYIWLPWVVTIVSAIAYYLYLRFFSFRENKYPIQYYRIRNTCQNKAEAVCQLLQQEYKNQREKYYFSNLKHVATNTCLRKRQQRHIIQNHS